MSASAAVGQLVPQAQSVSQAHGEQVQLGLSQPVGWPQVQSGPQAQGEQVQLGLSQVAVLMAAILCVRVRIAQLSAVSRRGRRAVLQ